MVLVAADYVPCDVYEPLGEVLDKLNSIFRLSPNEMATFVSMTKIVGISLSQTQAMRLLAIFAIMELLKLVERSRA